MKLPNKFPQPDSWVEIELSLAQYHKGIHGPKTNAEGLNTTNILLKVTGIFDAAGGEANGIFVSGPFQRGVFFSKFKDSEDWEMHYPDGILVHGAVKITPYDPIQSEI